MRRGRSTDVRGPLRGIARIAMLLLWLAAASAAHASDAPQELRFERAEFVVSDSETPPQTGWQPQSLPDSWLHNHPGLAGFAWYRMRFQLDAIPSQPIALFVARAALTGQFWLNGSALNPEVRFTQPEGPVGTNTGVRPQLIALPSGLLRVGENVLHARVQGFAVGGDGLWDVRVGPMDQLRGPWLVRHFFQRTIPEALFALMVASSVFGLLVWWRDRRAGNLHFMAAMVLWMAIVGIYVAPELPIERTLLVPTVTVVVTAFHWVLLTLFYRYSGSSWRWYPRVLDVVCAVVLLLALAIVIFEGASERSSERYGLLMVPMALLRVLATVMLAQAAWRTRSPGVVALAATEILWFGGYVQIMGILTGWWSPEPFRVDPATSLPLFLVLQLLFIDRFVRDREQAAREQQAAIDTERARILQDMHDGMGSQLITALRLVKRDDADRSVVASSIEEALQDLRLIIDSLDVREQGLVELLGNLRYRLEPRLAALGIRLQWQVQPLEELAAVTPHAALAVLRIVQEALNNAVKHARPETITISAARRDGRVVISVTDDGVGVGLHDANEAGRGLPGMRSRAQQIGATFGIERVGGGGTRVSLELPPQQVNA